MDNSWIEKVILNFFTSRVDLFGEQSTYHGFETNKPGVTSTPATPEGNNSIQLQGKIVYKEKRAYDCKAIPIFVKIMTGPDATYVKEFLSFTYANEINFYTKIVPKFGSLDHSIYSLFPKFYHAEMMFSEKQIKSAIIFDDLKARGYKLADKRPFLDYDHLKLMMRKLGQFHAYSYKAKTYSPEWFLPMSKSFQEADYFLIGMDKYNFLQAAALRGINALEQPSKYLPSNNKFTKNVAKIYRDVLTKDGENPISVIVHGDYLSRNVMFRYNENNTPDDVLMIDVATGRCGSPVIDLGHVLYLCADQTTRNNYWDKLIDEYYTALKEAFPENHVPSRNAILNEFVSKSFHAYLVAGYFIPYCIAIANNIPFPDDILMDPDTFEKYCEDNLEKISKETKKLLQIGGEQGTQAIKDILQDIIDRGFI